MNIRAETRKRDGGTHKPFLKRGEHDSSANDDDSDEYTLFVNFNEYDELFPRENRRRRKKKGLDGTQEGIFFIFTAFSSASLFSLNRVFNHKR